MENNGENPITRLTIKMERAARDVNSLNAWLRNPANEGSCDWDYNYREMRRAECTLRRTRVAILRLDRAIHAQAGFDYDSAIRKVRGLMAWCNRPSWRR